MSCGQIPAACPALIWGEVMRIMSKEGRGSLALVQLGPTAPWDTGQADRAQGALITRSVHPKGRERAEGSNDDGWGSSGDLALDRSERQKWGLWLEPVRSPRCGRYDRLSQQESLKWSLQYVFTWQDSPVYRTVFLLSLHYRRGCTVSVMQDDKQHPVDL